MSSVSRNIKNIRLRRKLTQEELAVRLFVTRQTVSNWENGKSQPDIDTLIKIADSLNTDATALIYGFPDSEDQKREKRHLAFAAGILLIMGISLYFLMPMAAESWEKYFLIEPMMLLQLYALPVVWLLVGWTIMQGLGVLGVAKPVRSKYSKAVHAAVLVVVLLYAVVMLPLMAGTIKSLVQVLQYRQDPSLYPDGYQFASVIPHALIKIEQKIVEIVHGHSAIFVIPAVIFWLSKPVRQER